MDSLKGIPMAVCSMESIDLTNDFISKIQNSFLLFQVFRVCLSVGKWQTWHLKWQ